MDVNDMKRQMISVYEEKLRLYQAMVAEWKADLGEAGIPTDSSAANANGAGKKTPNPGADLLLLVREYEFFNKSQPEAAKAFLEKVGHPAKTQAILDAIVKGGVTVGGKGDAKDKKMNLYTILHRSDDFKLFGKDTWGLESWPGGQKKEKESNAAMVETSDKK